MNNHDKCCNPLTIYQPTARGVWLVWSSALVYFVIVLLLQQVFAAVSNQRSEFVTALSTLTIAALFVPLRNRIQSTIDRRFYRKKYDAQQVLAKFAATVQNETDLARLTQKLLAVVNETMQPESATVWLKKEGRTGGWYANKAD